MSIALLPASQPITTGGVPNARFLQWTQSVSKLDLLSGSGTPEASVEAFPFRFYVNTAGGAGAVLYIKRDADIAGDKTKGWILV